ncbi:hypothetical protein MRB53_028126 [Persea americana]|uniref:Uncharacterized protein n=1 Tax=Persea americana TaxID=3435 RepID=A0ACC2KF00_PERAE|nr:hypothetical protein MRB53_028126 [Persea americana]
MASSTVSFFFGDGMRSAAVFHVWREAQAQTVSEFPSPSSFFNRTEDASGLLLLPRQQHRRRFCSGDAQRRRRLRHQARLQIKNLCSGGNRARLQIKNGNCLVSKIRSSVASALIPSRGNILSLPIPGTKIGIRATFLMAGRRRQPNVTEPPVRERDLRDVEIDELRRQVQ